MTAPYRKVNYSRIFQKYSLIVALLFLAPLTVIILGLIVFTTYNGRIDAIQAYVHVCHHKPRYNERTRKWADSMNSFNQSLFSFSDDPFDVVRINPSPFFPVADSCGRKGDPTGGCLSEPSVYHRKMLFLSMNTVNITIRHNSSVIVSEAVPIKKTQVFSRRTLGCWDDYNCDIECKEMNGKWDYKRKECTVLHYLSSICYRVASKEDSFVLDNTGYD